MRSTRRSLRSGRSCRRSLIDENGESGIWSGDVERRVRRSANFETLLFLLNRCPLLLRLYCIDPCFLSFFLSFVGLYSRFYVCAVRFFVPRPDAAERSHPLNYCVLCSSHALGPNKRFVVAVFWLPIFEFRRTTTRVQNLMEDSERGERTLVDRLNGRAFFRQSTGSLHNSLLTGITDSFPRSSPPSIPFSPSCSQTWHAGDQSQASACSARGPVAPKRP